MGIGKRSVAIGLGLTLLLAACGDDGGDGAAGGNGPTEASPSTDESPAEETATLRLAKSDLGSILVDADGMTLYLFEADTDGSSTCYDDCATSWPALIDDAPSAGAGVDESLLGTTERDDGEVQVTYGGQPLYSFAPDQAPGDVEGQGVGDVWFVVDASGDAVVEEARRPGY